MPARATLEAEVLSSVRPSKAQCAPLPAVVGLSKPVIRLKNVVLPAPFGPISAVISAALHLEVLHVDGGHAAELAHDVVDDQDRVGLARRPGVASKPAVSACARRRVGEVARDLGVSDLLRH